MNPTYDFSGQVALVTGAAMGMGLATARAFAEGGAAVVLADIDGALAAREAERITAKGGKAIGLACDVADEAQVAAMIDRTVATSLTHIAVQEYLDGKAVEWMEHVTDEHYLAGRDRHE